MRVLLINPFYPISETPSPPLGLAYLAGALEAEGARVRVLDYVVHPFDEADLRQVLDDFAPQLAGATAVTMTVDNALGILAAVKRLRPQTTTALGGPHVTFTAEATLLEHPPLDVAVLGEGEETIVALARAVRSGSGLEQVAGIAFRHGGRVHFTPPRPPIEDLDRLPMPARHLLSLGRYRALGMPVSMTTSRGCPHRCIFCVGRQMVGARVRYRSAGQVAAEMQQLASLGFHQINLADDLFTANRRHCLAVCEEILRRGLAVRWTSFARVDTVDEALLARMREAGCTAVSFGIESGSPAILKTIRKGIRRRQVVAAVEACRRAGVAPYASFILGLPGETEKTLRETFAFGEELKQMGLMYGFHLLAPFPGTEVRQRHTQYGIRILSDDWSRYHANRAVAETEAVSARRLDELASAWEAEFNAHLAAIGERMAAGSATAEEAGQIIGLEDTVTIYELMMRRALERHGRLPAPGDSSSGGWTLGTLCRRLAAAEGLAPERVAGALSRAAARGNLSWERRGAWVYWRWREQLPGS